MKSNIKKLSELDNSNKKITKSWNIDDFEVLTDDGFIDIVALHETIPYEVYNLKLSDGKELKCADNHIVFDEYMNEVYVKDLVIGDRLITEENKTSIVISNESLGYNEVMYDLELPKDSNHRYFTNGILSHNTFLAKSLAEILFGDSEKMIRIDMSEYMEKHNVSRLIGAPPGYVGYDEGGILTEKVKNNPFSVILFDEIEKAHKDVFNILLQILDDGHLTDSFGRKVNFTNTLIIMTSNVGAKKVSDFGNGVGFRTNNNNTIQDDIKKTIILKSLKQEFSPEFLNRIDDVIMFNPLDKEVLKKIIGIELGKLKNRLLEKKYFIKFDDTVFEKIYDLNKEEEYGARPIKRIIQNLCEDFLSEEILKNNIIENEKFIVKYENNELNLSKE